MPEATSFDFDRWATLAREQPAEFEKERRRALARFMRSVPPQRRQRLRCLQWRVDQVRRSSGTPLAACMQISKMMWETLQGPNGLVPLLRNPHPENRPKAAVIPFSPR